MKASEKQGSIIDEEKDWSINPGPTMDRQPNWRRSPAPDMETEVKMRIREENRMARINDLENEKVKFPEGFIDNLLGQDQDISWETWKLLRKARKNIISVTVSRENGVTIEHHVSAGNVLGIKQGRGDTDANILLYGPELEAQNIWRMVDKEAKEIKVDLRSGSVFYA